MMWEQITDNFNEKISLLFIDKILLRRNEIGWKKELGWFDVVDELKEWEGVLTRQSREDGADFGGHKFFEVGEKLGAF